MTQAHQIEQVSKTQKLAQKIKEELQAIDDKSKADIIQRQAAEKALDDLKKAGAHIGYANANRHTDDAVGRLKGIAATNANVSVSLEELNEAVE